MGRKAFGNVFKRGKTFYIRYLRDGCRVTKAVGPSKTDATDALKGIASDLAREKYLGIRPVAEATLAEVWKQVESGRRARLTARAFAVQRDHIEDAGEFFGQKPVCALRTSDVEAFLDSVAQREGGRKGTTINRYLTSVSSVLAEALERGFARENVAARATRRREEMPPTPFLGEAEIARLIAAASPDLRPIVAVLADTGLRRGELLDLAWQDVDLARGVVIVRRAKSGKGREVPLTTRVREAFGALRAARGPIPMVGADQVFAPLLERRRRKWEAPEGTTPLSDRERAEALLSKRFTRLAARVGLPEGTSLHALRHSCASRMVIAGVPLSAVAVVTGHSTLTCAARYGRHAPADAGLQAVRALEAGTAAFGSTPRMGEAKGSAG